LKRGGIQGKITIPPSEMRTAARFNFPEFAHLARTVLGDHDIEAFVFDENLVQLDWLLCNAIGGVRLVVNLADYSEAVRILKSCAGRNTDGECETFSVPAGHIFRSNCTHGGWRPLLPFRSPDLHC
jgi:hypothetical protein